MAAVIEAKVLVHARAVERTEEEGSGPPDVETSLGGGSGRFAPGLVASVAAASLADEGITSEYRF
jgi:hypothetical protein